MCLVGSSYSSSTIHQQWNLSEVTFRSLVAFLSHLICYHHHHHHHHHQQEEGEKRTGEWKWGQFSAAPTASLPPPFHDLGKIIATSVISLDMQPEESHENMKSHSSFTPCWAWRSKTISDDYTTSLICACLVQISQFANNVKLLARQAI